MKTPPEQTIPPVQSGALGQSFTSGQPVQNGQPIGSSSQPSAGMGGMPMVQQVQVAPKQKKDIVGLVKTIAIIAVSLIAVTFIGLFIWAMLERNEAQTNLDGKIDAAVAEAKDEQWKEDEANRLKYEKYPYKVFSGPADYGHLSFEYPKTWSVYVAAAATTGGDFNAYFNPIQVDAVGKDTINALRVSIRDKSFDEVAKEYQKAMDKKDSNLTVESTTIGKQKNITANRYTGTIPDTDLSGFIVTFKIRDKTAILQTDSVLFQEDFDKLLGTVEFNE